ncbi:MAG: hypothetical protein IPM92_16645 [Saprospiraceae bacterium]|nr:hypothetical protein [Saprospiraceae bacterium]
MKTSYQDIPAEVAVEWNKMFLEIERFAAGYRPGPAPRALGLMGLATMKRAFLECLITTHSKQIFRF